MPQIPVMPAPSPRQAPGMPRANASGPAAVAAATDRLGASIAGAGSQIVEFQQRKAEAVNWASELAVQNKQREIFDSFQQSLLDPNNPANAADPQDPKAGYNARLAEAHAQFDTWMTEQNFPQAVAEKAAPLTASWKQQTNAAVGNQVTQLQVSKAAGDYEVARQNALRDGNWVLANALTGNAEQRGLVSPERAAKDRSEAPADAQRYEVLSLISADPIAAEKALDDIESFTRLNDETRLSLAYNASTAANRVRADNADALFAKRQAFLSGEGPDVTPDEARAMEADGRLSRGAAAPYLKPPKAEFDPEHFAALYNRISNYNKDADPSAKEYSELMGLASQYKAETGLIGILTAKRKDPNSIENKSVSSYGAGIINRAYENATQPLLWIPPNYDTKEPGRHVTPSNVREAAEVARAAAFKSLREFLENHPEADEVMVQRHLAPLITTAASAATFITNGNTSKPVTSKKP